MRDKVRLPLKKSRNFWPKEAVAVGMAATSCCASTSIIEWLLRALNSRGKTLSFCLSERIFSEMQLLIAAIIRNGTDKSDGKRNPSSSCVSVYSAYKSVGSSIDREHHGNFCFTTEISVYETTNIAPRNFEKCLPIPDAHLLIHSRFSHLCWKYN